MFFLTLCVHKKGLRLIEVKPFPERKIILLLTLNNYCTCFAQYDIR